MIETIGTTFYLRRRIPKRYHGVVDGRAVRLSLHTDSQSVAKAKAERVWSDLIESWEARLAGDTADAEARLAAAKNLAAARGYRFMMANEVARLPTDDFLSRVAEVAKGSRPGRTDMLAADALLGTISTINLPLSRLAEEFFKLAKDRTLGKNKQQLRVWKNPRSRAVANFAAQIEDKDIGDITTEDFMDLREWWVDRMEEEGVGPATANKDLIYLRNMLKTVARAKEIKLAYNGEGLLFKEGKQRQRPPFSEPWIRDTLLAPGALDGMNLQARCVLLGMINTGYRPSEVQNILPEHIRLDAEVPHIVFKPEGRTLKNHHSERVIPLVGVSLEAFRQCPSGFSRYLGKSGPCSTVNRYLRMQGLLETPEHSLYSLRHSFEDRMLAAGIDERIRRDLMGHKLVDRERYGRGASLKQLKALLEAIAL